jgi:hypothetical protein
MAWQEVGGAQTGGNNVPIDPNVHWLGTRNAAPLIIRTENGPGGVNAAAEVARFTAAAGGRRVGIGTNAPNRTLHVQPSEIHSGGGAGYSFGNRQTTAFVETPAAGERWVWYANGGTARLWSGTDKLAVTPAGNVGIGTTEPITDLQLGESGLQIGFSSTASDNFHFTSDIVGGSRGLRIWNGNYGSGTHILTALPNGNVGIGTNTPRDRLQIGSTLALHEGGHAVMTFGWAWNNGTPQVLRQGFPAEIRWAPTEGSLSLGIDRSSRSPGQTPAPASILTLRSNGNVEVVGDIRLSNADCAEDFDVAEIEEIEPGTVVVIDEEGAVNRSTQAYDKRVAGVISGAGDYRSGIILDNQAARKDRIPVALMGKVYCMVDARPSPIGVGDLLTTSSTPGRAMKVDDPVRASGATIGKALKGLAGGQGLLPILVSLQ